MKIGVGSYAYRWSIGIADHQPAQPLTPVGFLERAADLGAQVVQYADNMPLHAESAGTVHAIAAAAGERGVDVELGTHGGTPENLATYLDLASELKAKVVRVSLSEDDLGQPKQELVKVLAEGGRTYQKIGCVIALENHFLLTSDDLAGLVEEVDHPAVGVCLDVANSIVSGEWPGQTIDRLVPYALNLHIKDYRFDIDAYGAGFRAVGTPIGDGQLDVAHVFDALRRAGRDVNAIVEHWIPKESLQGEPSATTIEDEWTRRSIEAVRAHVSVLS